MAMVAGLQGHCCLLRCGSRYRFLLCAVNSMWTWRIVFYVVTGMLGIARRQLVLQSLAELVRKVARFDKIPDCLPRFIKGVC